MSDNVVVIGTQWGDEGKGKIVDLLTEQADVIVRFQGGNNAGHTLVAEDRKIVLHLIPSGILHMGKMCLIGNGVVLDPEVFCEELDRLQQIQVDAGPEHLKVSHKAHLILPYHKQLDGQREKMKSGKDRIGTTGRGIGPAYEDKVSRIGIRACDILDEELLVRKIERALEEKNVLFQKRFEVEPFKPEEVLEAILPATRRLQPYLTDVSGEIARAKEEGKAILFEGAQGVHLDIDHGTYPFVTSSNTVASNAATGSGCGLSTIDRVTAVVKAYTTRVGAGPFPTELEDERGDLLQRQGAEFGATTGRKRRCGWLDLVILRESVRLNGPSEIALTKLDVLSGLEEINVCTRYLVDNEVFEHPPQLENGLAKVTPVYESLPGWSEDISQAKAWDDLPRAAQEYIRYLEQELRVRVGIISVGPDRSQTLIRSAEPVS